MTDNMTLYTFQLTCFLALGLCCVKLRVLQMPESAHLKEGESVNLSCTFTWNTTSIRKVTTVSVEWYRTSSLISFQQHHISGRRSFTDILHFHSVHRNQSGKYFCNVTILTPCIERRSGSGTNLTVEVLTLGTVGESSSLTVVWTSLMAAALAVGIGCVIYSKRKGKIRNASTGQETVCPTQVFYEVVYAKLNIRNSNTRDGSNKDEAQYCNKPQVGTSLQDSGCLRTAVAENVLYSTLKSAAPELQISDNLS